MRYGAWADREWHPAVHQRLGEQLVYYLVRVRPYENKCIVDKVSKLLDKEALDSVRLFEIFGPKDLVVRAWLHTKVANEFPKWLKGALVVGADLRPFIVETIVQRSNATPAIPESAERLLDRLDDETIRAVQSGHDGRLLDRLIEAGLVLVRDPSGADPIKFFVAITLAHKDLRVAAAKELATRLVETAANKPSVYLGLGFCDILLKAEVPSQHFFTISELVNWITVLLENYGPTTETYVVARPTPLVETPDTISEATFRGIRGTNLFVQSIIPELYESYYSDRKPIEDLLTELRPCIGPEEKRLIHDYLLAFLRHNESELGMVVYKFFTELEAYLRQNHRGFVGRLGQDLGALCRDLQIPKDAGKKISIGSLLALCSVAASRSGLVPSDAFSGGWNDLVELRNRVSHGDWDHRTTWASDLTVLLKPISRLRLLLRAIASQTGQHGDLTYLWPED